MNNDNRMKKTEKILHEDKYSKTVQYIFEDEHGRTTATQNFSKCYYLNNETNEIDFYLQIR